MKTIMVNYDLIGPDRDYPRLFSYLEALGSHTRPLRSMWLVRTFKSVTQVRDELKRFVDANDEVVVMDVTGDSWATNFSDTTTAWMKGNMGLRRAA